MEFIFPFKATEADTASEDEDSAEMPLKVRLLRMVESATGLKNKPKEKEQCRSQRPSKSFKFIYFYFVSKVLVSYQLTAGY